MHPKQKEKKGKMSMWRKMNARRKKNVSSENIRGLEESC